MEQKNTGGDIQKFFSNDLKAMFTGLFKKPSSCVEHFVRESGGISVSTPICTVVLSFLVMMLCSLAMLLASGVTEYMKFGDILVGCFKTGIVPLIFAAILTVLLYVTMAMKGCTDFKLAFFNVSLHLLVYCMVMVFLTLLIIIAGKHIREMFPVILIIFTMVYALAWGIGNIRQAVMAICGSEAYSWWMAPIVIGLTIVLTYLIVKGMVPKVF